MISLPPLCRFMPPSVATDGPAQPPAQAVGVMIARRFNGWAERKLEHH